MWTLLLRVLPGLCGSYVLTASLHHAHEHEHEFQDQDQDDRDFEELPARDGGLLEREARDVVERFELLLDVRLPGLETEPIGDETEHPCGIDVADEFERVLGPIRELVDIDEQRV